MTQSSDTPAQSSSPDPWAQVREDYLSGVSAPALAERYGLSERTIRRRAFEAGWRRTDGGAPMRRMPLKRDEAMEMFPELQAVEAMAAEERMELLIYPQSGTFRRYAFLQAAEAAALGEPRQATLWMRLVRQLDQTRGGVENARPPFDAADYMRAGFLKRLQAEAAAASVGEDEE